VSWCTAEERSKVQVGRTMGEGEEQGVRSERRKWGARWHGSEEQASKRRRVEGAVGECCNSEQSEARRPDENKRHGNEQGIKKRKVVVHVTTRVRPEGVTGIRLVALPFYFFTTFS
jgi:hypothetical protein